LRTEAGTVREKLARLCSTEDNCRNYGWNRMVSGPSETHRAARLFMSAPKSSWLLHRLNPSARMRLFCLPYAGGGASVYRSWPGSFPKEIEVCCVQLPGRENRLAESLFSSIDPLVETMAQALSNAFDRPFALFGHSMGG
jgi:hypothetical protein